ncbi:uncharacterized protein LOC133737938 isoform X1 [Rosa rugosa]|uniref:uncharacterized protein LOC133737938 isoform X1 n=1 Tax=Rosa rugosa TaxID=74645 RepID=UPI002B400F6C|nr:uncharacterized protein LOC133737938 isoform X1 [Rosa rugosa]
MKGKLLAWLLLMILSSLALTKSSSFHLEHHQGDINLSRPIVQEQETIHGVLGTMRLNGSEEDYGRGSNKEQEDLVVSEKGQKGKTGVYGGANVAHHPRQQKSSATPRPNLIAKTMLHVSFTLVLIFSSRLL